MNNWYARNHKVSPEAYRKARDGLRCKFNHGIHTKILEFNNNCRIKDEKMSEKEKEKTNTRLNDKSLDILFHFDDNPHGADLRCEYSEWMGYDLNQCPGVGEWKCKLQGHRYASDQYGYDSYDYHECDRKNHTNCDVYNKHQGGKNEKTG